MKNALSTNSTRNLEKTLIGFFVLCALSIIVVYIIDPPLFANALQQQAPEGVSLISPIGLFLLGILAIITCGIYGITRHWRWIFWVLLIAFCASILELPVSILQFAGIVPDPFGYPLWYSLYRLGVSFIEIALGVWMLRVYLKNGVWGLGKRKAIA